MTLAGTRKAIDPNDVIFTDRYRLVVGENGRTLGGVSRNLGDWDDRVFPQRWTTYSQRRSAFSRKRQGITRGLAADGGIVGHRVAPAFLFRQSCMTAASIGRSWPSIEQCSLRRPQQKVGAFPRAAVIADRRSARRAS